MEKREHPVCGEGHPDSAGLGPGTSAPQPDREGAERGRPPPHTRLRPRPAGLSPDLPPSGLRGVAATSSPAGWPRCPGQQTPGGPKHCSCTFPRPPRGSHLNGNPRRVISRHGRVFTLLSGCWSLSLPSTWGMSPTCATFPRTSKGARKEPQKMGTLLSSNHCVDDSAPGQKQLCHLGKDLNYQRAPPPFCFP